MSTTAPQPATTPIPVHLSEPEFEAFILPHLSMPKRGPKCKLGYYRVFNLILRVLYTGMRWKCLPIPNANHGYVLAPLPVAPVNETDMVLLPKGLQALKQVAKEVGLDLRGAYVNLDGGFDSRANRTCMFNAGMIPNIKENPRNRKTTKRGRKRFFSAAIHALRMRVERTFAWEDKFKRLLLRFERIQQRHYRMKLLAYTLINLRAFCGT